MTEQERMKAGYMWLDDAENMEMQARARELVTRFNALPADANRERMEMNQEMFGSCGKNVWIVPPLKFTIGKHITIGEGCYFNQGTTLIDDWKIEIGDHCLFGPNVTLCTTGHPISPSHRGDGMYSFPIRLGNNVWIGANVVILPDALDPAAFDGDDAVSHCREGGVVGDDNDRHAVLAAGVLQEL